MKYLNFIAILIFVFSTALSAQKIYNVDSIHVSISPAQGKDTMASHLNDPWFVVLDVRTAGEYNPSHISGAANIDRNSPVLNQMLDSLNKDKVYIVHCASGGRATYVCGVMRTKHFRYVYNMGGISAWTAAGFPVTSAFAPSLGLLSDSIVPFYFQNIPSPSSIPITITNRCNSTLTFLSVSGLNGSDFSTDFNLSKTLQGARDYTFNYDYNPTGVSTDTALCTIVSNAGSLTLFLISIDVTKINTITNSILAVYYDSQNKTITINNPFENKIINAKIYTINGQIIYSDQLYQKQNRVAIATIKSGMYILEIVSDNDKRTLKFIVL